MITQAFHEEIESLFTPEAYLGDRQYLCDVAIGTFSCEIRDAVIEQYPYEVVAHTGSANGHRPIYMLNVDGRRIIFYMSSIGSALAGNDIIEVQWQTGIQKLILFGSAGSLDQQATTGKYVIPTQAYRDEGMSYHYAPPSDYIAVSNSGVLTAVFEKLHLPYVNGRVWTTDAPYRETRTAVRRRKDEGCIAVEMELAGVQAVCSFYGIELYDFLVTGDILDGEVYDSRGLRDANHSLDKFYVALKIAEELCKAFLHTQDESIRKDV